MNQSKKPDGAYILIVTDILNSKVVSITGYLVRGGRIPTTWSNQGVQNMPARVNNKKLSCTFTWIDVNGAGANLQDAPSDFKFTPMTGTKNTSPFEDSRGKFPIVINGNGAENLVIFQPTIEQTGDWTYEFKINTPTGVMRSESLGFDPEMRVGP